MDRNILNNIISSSDVADLEHSHNWTTITNEEEYPITKSTLIDKLSKTFTKLLMYKVSREAYQRYSVKLNIIDTLRDWYQLKGDMGTLPYFFDTENSYNFFLNLLVKCLTPEILVECDNINDLIQIAEILLNTSLKSKEQMKCFVKIIDTILDLKQNERSKQFLNFVILKSDEIKLESSIIENIYTSQKFHLIEKPLTDCFLVYCSNKNELDLTIVDLLFKKLVDNPTLFQLVSNELKELFFTTNYSQESQDFIQKVLEKIEEHCNKYNKDTLDLYPSSLQFCVLLLRIKPNYYTETTKNHTLKILKNLFLKDFNGLLLLISHFPDWLPEYLNIFENFDDCSQKSNFTEHTSIDEIKNEINN